MVVRMVRAVVGTAVLCSVGLAVAAPAQATVRREVPGTRSAQVTIDSFWAVSAQEIEVHGTVTCTQPTGSAHVFSSVVQVMPFTFGGASTDVPCASGPVSWQVTVFLSDGWDPFRQVRVNALMDDEHGGSAQLSVDGWA